MDENLKSFVAGIDLAGQRLPNGKLKSYLSDSVIDNWPTEIELFGNIYTLENIAKGEDGYESGVYV